MSEIPDWLGPSKSAYNQDNLGFFWRRALGERRDVEKLIFGEQREFCIHFPQSVRLRQSSTGFNATERIAHIVEHDPDGAFVLPNTKKRQLQLARGIVNAHQRAALNAQVCDFIQVIMAH